MALFDECIQSLREYLQEKASRGIIRKIESSSREWPSSKGPNIILKEDTWIELGNPKMASKAFLLWTEDLSKVMDGAITLVGPELDETSEKSLPFAQIIIVGGHDFEDDNYIKLRRLQYDIDLDGYMIRTVPQRQRIWSRVSIDAAEKGFRLEDLGNALIKNFKSKMSFVDAAEVIFITSSKQDVNELDDISIHVQRIVSAMDKMTIERSLDCDTCEYVDVCGTIPELRAYRERLKSSDGGA